MASSNTFQVGHRVVGKVVGINDVFGTITAVVGPPPRPKFNVAFDNGVVELGCSCRSFNATPHLLPPQPGLEYVEDDDYVPIAMQPYTGQLAANPPIAPAPAVAIGAPVAVVVAPNPPVPILA